MTEPRSMSFRAKLNFENPPKLWALRKGGRAIPPLVEPPNFLMDSNAVTYLQNRAKLLLPPESGWWDSLLSSGNTVLNPVPNAFEGNTGIGHPTREAFEKRFRADNALLVEAFPKVTVIDYNEKAFEGVYSMVTTVAEANERENEFLVAAARLIMEGVKQHARLAIETEIFEIAKANGIRSDSFALYAVLSCLYSPNAKIPVARGILKPKTIIDTNNAYNALVDISLLRLLTASIAYFTTPEMPSFALLSADRDLINFWCGLRIKDFKVNTAGAAEAVFSFSEPMFSSLSEDERHQLSVRVGSL